ncbi:hypothetical protein I7I50_11798 [Histoplasma capsulatum G186AR]|uniref:Uncharacterized protein n=1 Tax=Ajellomyces capsulatus TaxID=5037 RepID=A0A8H8D883_AJECA|nr:hypothetical protein I7I52_03036 [Histoplasma capsulatum]QSS70237.1 hypothetical protein I7I50_11798 [Histoplasma capsulatum G186AR]
MRPLITTLMNSPLKKARQCQKKGSLCEVLSILQTQSIYSCDWRNVFPNAEDGGKQPICQRAKGYAD